MGEKEQKIVIVIIKVDLECCCCSKKIKSSLCKLQEKFKVNSIVFDDKKSTVTVSGPFNPDCFVKKLCCMAHKVIKDVQIKKPDPPPPPPPKKDPVPPPPPPKKDPVPPPPPPKTDPVPPPPPPKTDPPKLKPKPEPEPAPPQELLVKFPVWAMPTPIWPCCCQPCPCFEPRHGRCRCCSCGHVSDGQPPPPPPQPVYYGGFPCYEAPGYKIVCEDEPSYGCSVM